MSDGLFGSIKISASGLSGMRTKMDTVAKNLANAETTRTDDGTPYRRGARRFPADPCGKAGGPSPSRAGGPAAAGCRPRIRATSRAGAAASERSLSRGVDMDVETAPDASEFKVVYDPGHPDADAEGYVLMPNVNVVTEMVDMITASRAYEANVSAVQSAKQMFAKALDI